MTSRFFASVLEERRNGRLGWTATTRSWSSQTKRLLARFHYLKVDVRVTQAAANGQPLVIAHQQLFLASPKSHKKRR